MKRAKGLPKRIKPGQKGPIPKKPVTWSAWNRGLGENGTIKPTPDYLFGVIYFAACRIIFFSVGKIEFLNKKSSLLKLRKEPVNIRTRNA